MLSVMMAGGGLGLQQENYKEVVELFDQTS